MLTTQEKGKWWIVGSAYSRFNPEGGVGGEGGGGGVKEAVEGAGEGLMKLAKAQGMNTDIRRAVFCTLLSSEVNFFFLSFSSHIILLLFCYFLLSLILISRIISMPTKKSRNCT